MKDGRPLGLVHARSESGRRGLVEVIWSLDPRLRVRDFSFQRCRSRTRSSVETDEFKRQLIGKGPSELRALLTADGKRLAPGRLRVPRGSSDLATTVVRSAIKTIAVTRLAWAEDLEIIRPLYEAYAAFPSAVGVEVVSEPYSEIVRKNLQAFFSGSGPGAIRRGNVQVIRATDARGEVLGHVMRTPWSSLNENADLWWVIRKDVVVEDVAAEYDWPNATTREAFWRPADWQSIGAMTAPRRQRWLRPKFYSWRDITDIRQ